MSNLIETDSLDLDVATQLPRTFYEEVIIGLKSKRKHLSSKYFYDKEGDILFQKIMDCDDYYLTRCELDIFKNKSPLLSEAILANDSPFDLIELGAGDGTKTFYFLKHLFETKADFNYFPIDISGHILDVLEKNLKLFLPDVNVFPLQGDYLEELSTASNISENRKVLMFLGSNIGNMSTKESIEFCKKLSANLSTGDKLIIGFDLKKNPATVLRAYNDSEGITRDFNLNLLKRINRELSGDFNISQFEHYQTYDPESGACKSFLVSICKQDVCIGCETISFEENETIYMEVSQKYSVDEIDQIAYSSGFRPVSYCFDDRNYFLDTVWEAV